MNNELDELYESTAEDLRFGIGTLELPNLQPAPIILVHYCDWSLEKLDVIRESFRDGVILLRGRRSDDARDLYLATRERICLQAEQDGHTSMLRAPAWDARLANVDVSVLRIFEAERQHFSGFLLLVQAEEWEFLTVVDDSRDRTIVGAVLPQFLPMPKDHTTH